MPNNSSENVERQAVNDQPLTALLAFLSHDPDKANRHYLRLHEKLEGYFRFKGMSDPVHDADDALDRAAKKIANGVDVPEVDRFCIGIARNIVMERLRQKKREESAFIQFIDRSQSNKTETLVDRITNLMKPCFDRLPADDRDLLTSYCKVPQGLTRAEHRRRLAASLKSSIAALRIRVTRLRRGLEECVKALSKKQ